MALTPSTMLPLGTTSGLPITSLDLEMAIEKGLAAGGRPVLPAVEASRRLPEGSEAPDCRAPECWRKLGKSLGTSLIVSGRVEEVAATFRVTLLLVGAERGDLLGVEENQCESADCALTELVRLSAWELMRKAAPVRKATPMPVALQEASGPGRVVPGASEHRHEPWLWPAVAVGTGAVFVGVGAVLLKVANQHKNCDATEEYCSNYYTTRPAGWISLAGGLIAAGVGTVFLMRDGAPASRASVGVTAAPGRGGLLMTGRF
jgi:hypothetical protein